MRLVPSAREDLFCDSLLARNPWYFFLSFLREFSELFFFFFLIYLYLFVLAVPSLCGCAGSFIAVGRGYSLAEARFSLQWAGLRLRAHGIQQLWLPGSRGQVQ